METAGFVHAYFARHVPKAKAEANEEMMWLCQTVSARKGERCMSGVTAIVRTASRGVGTVHEWPWLISATKLPHPIACTHPVRYSFFVAVCMVSLSEKSQHCVSVCVEYMQCMLAKWLILSLALSFGNSLDRSRICADRIARFRFSSMCTC